METPPDLKLETLAPYGCYYMFDGCTSLNKIHKLLPLTLQPYCYANMYSGCTSLKFSATQTNECDEGYRVPFSGTGTTASNALNNMLANTGGTFTGTPNINTNYFTNATIINVWPTVLYQLPGVTTFNGSNTYVNTGLTVLDIDKDYSVFIDYVATNVKGQQKTIIHCQIEKNPWPGFCIDITSNKFRLNYFGRTEKTADTNRHKVLFIHQGGTTRTCVWYYDNTTPIAYTGDRTYTNNVKTLLVGCYRDDNGNLGRFFEGTVYDFKVYDAVLPQSLINELMGS